jgi:hypothetical protein
MPVNIIKAGGTAKSDYTPTDIVDMIYPIGSIYSTRSNTDPSILFTGTTWKKLTEEYYYPVTLFNQTSWANMLKTLQTIDIDFNGYAYTDVYFMGQGGTNATSTILRASLTNGCYYRMVYKDVSYNYGASICFPDVQLLWGQNNDPGIFRIGYFISQNKQKLLVGDTGYFIGSTGSGNFDSGSIYNRVCRIVGYKKDDLNRYERTA